MYCYLFRELSICIQHCEALHKVITDKATHSSDIAANMLNLATVVLCAELL